MDGWNIALWVGAGLLAVVSLARLMIGRRDEVRAELQAEVAAEQERQRQAADAAKPRRDRAA